MTKITEEPILLAYVCEANGQHNGSIELENALESVVAFIVEKGGTDGTIIFTDTFDNFLLKTSGLFLEICVDAEYAIKLKKSLSQYQLVRRPDRSFIIDRKETND